MANIDHDILIAAQEWRGVGGEVAIGAVIETWGSAPRVVGAHRVADREGHFPGSVSGGCVEGAVIDEALDVIANDAPKVLAFGIADETAWRLGLFRGGCIKIDVERLD